MALQRKLTALGYHSTQINFQDQEQVRKLIVWLDENKIRQYKNDERRKLFDNKSNFIQSFEKYMVDLKCPIKSEKLESRVDWCLGYAIKLEYDKNKDTYNKHSVQKRENSNIPSVTADNPLDHLDFTGKEFQEGINKLANLLKIPTHPDSFETLEGCSKLIQKRLNTNILQNPKDLIITGTPFPYRTADLGFDLNGAALTEAAKVLRLLYIQDLRNLQTKVNECIVAVQTVTANPKTDTKLGKVGR